METKSGRNKKSKTLNALLSEKDRKRIGFRLAEGNTSVDDKGAIHLPLYGVCFMRGSGATEIGPLDPSDVNRRFRDLSEVRS